MYRICLTALFVCLFVNLAEAQTNSNDGRNNDQPRASGTTNQNNTVTPGTYDAKTNTYYNPQTGQYYYAQPANQVPRTMTNGTYQSNSYYPNSNPQTGVVQAGAMNSGDCCCGQTNNGYSNYNYPTSDNGYYGGRRGIFRRW